MNEHELKCKLRAKGYESMADVPSKGGGWGMVAAKDAGYPLPYTDALAEELNAQEDALRAAGYKREVVYSHPRDSILRTREQALNMIGWKRGEDQQHEGVPGGDGAGEQPEGSPGDDGGHRQR